MSKNRTAVARRTRACQRATVAELVVAHTLAVAQGRASAASFTRRELMFRGAWQARESILADLIA